MSSPQVHPATALRRTLESADGFVFAPGAHDGLSARIALNTGFQYLYMTGAGTSASLLGAPDIALASLPEMASHAAMLANLDRNVPLIADMDTGYGGPANVARSVGKYVAAGVAAFHIEDQSTQKRCGHLGNKQLVGTDVFVSRIKAAVSARKRLGSDIVLIARTDALASLGYDEALARLRAAHAAGADVLFLEGVESEEMMGKIVRDVAPVPVLLNMVEHGKTPTVSVQRAKEIGFRMVIWPFAGVAPALLAMRKAYAGLKETGLMGDVGKVTPRELFEECGLSEWMKIDLEAGGEDFKNGV